MGFMEIIKGSYMRYFGDFGTIIILLPSIKLNLRKKRTLIIKGLLGNLV